MGRQQRTERQGNRDICLHLPPTSFNTFMLESSFLEIWGLDQISIFPIVFHETDVRETADEIFGWGE